MPACMPACLLLARCCHPSFFFTTTTQGRWKLIKSRGARTGPFNFIHICKSNLCFSKNWEAIATPAPHGTDSPSWSRLWQGSHYILMRRNPILRTGIWIVQIYYHFPSCLLPAACLRASLPHVSRVANGGRHCLTASLVSLEKLIWCTRHFISCKTVLRWQNGSFGLNFFRLPAWKPACQPARLTCPLSAARCSTLLPCFAAVASQHLQFA